jgi:hypothetical protein
LPRSWLLGRTGHLSARSLKNTVLSRHLIFDWTAHRWNQPLLGFLGASLLLHFAAFYLFHIVYPTTTSLLPPTAHVSVLNLKNPDDRRILNWVELHDPSTLSAPKFRSDLLSLVPRYRPSFSAIGAEPLAEPQPTISLNVTNPSLFSAENLLPLRARPAITPVKRTFLTQLEFAGDLRVRHPEWSGSPPVASESLEPCTFFVGASAAGEVVYCFLWHTSGNQQRDAQTEQFIRRIHFRQSGSPTWGLITLHWGTTGS